ncbi:MAG: exodeoxyribonuclease VII small subunit [Candidatus Neomarinimicrobiota bacterium]|nr:MAG: exodeoxyribonuclease VII small subunit [Candidatus Neomarinimicrobiota bacterium]
MGSKKTMSLETAFQQLEDIVKKLESGEESLEDTLKLFEQGMLLIRETEAMLETARQKVEVLSGSTSEEPSS